MRALFTVLVLLAGCFSAFATEAEAVSTSAVAQEAEHFGQMYFAPMMTSYLWRLYAPGVGIVEFRRRSDKGDLDGAAGWSAKITGDVQTVTPPVVAGQPSYVYQFKKGRPYRLLQGKNAYGVSWENEPVCTGAVPPLWEENMSEEEKQRILDIWRTDKRRFRLFYTNPNRTAVLLACLALIFFNLLLFGRTRGWKISGAVATPILFVLLCLTYSRGGILAFSFGASVQILCRLLASGRRRIALLGVVGMLTLALIFVLGRDWGKFHKAESARLDILRVAPRMLVSAPGGWSAVSSAGQSFDNWYRPLNRTYKTFTLVSGHLTKLAEYGWFGRFVWLFGWIGALTALAVFAKKGGSPLPFAEWAAFGLATVFNPMHNSWSLWILPIASSVLWLKDCPWRDWRSYRWPLVGVAVVVAVALVIVWNMGSCPPLKGEPSLHVDGARVLVNGDKPSCWVVDDEETLGFVRAPNEIRYFYSKVPTAPALGYVRNISDLPSGVSKLVVAGARCRDYLDLWKKGKAPRARQLVFVSPPFGPKEVPPEIANSGSFLMVLGEFAARYVDVYGVRSSFPDWVGTVDGAEVYIPGWVGMAISK